MRYQAMEKKPSTADERSQSEKTSIPTIERSETVETAKRSLVARKKGEERMNR